MRTGGTLSRSAGALVITLVVAAVSPTNAAASYDALLLWSAVPDAAGYRVYMKRNSGSYDPPVDIGRRTPDADGIVTFELSSVAIVDTTHFGVTSYDESGLESDMSNEIALNRDVILANSGDANEPTSPPAGADDEDRLSIDVPMNGWERAVGRGSIAVQNDALVLDPDNDEKPLEARYPGSGSLQSALPEIEFRLQGAARTEFATRVRVAGGGWRRLHYQVAEGPIRLRGKRAWIPIGGDTTMRVVRRDLEDDVAAIFGAEFLHVEQVSVRGSVELRRITLREKGVGATPMERFVALPIAEWSPEGNTYGPIADEHTGSLAVASEGRRLTFPGNRNGQLFAPFERLAVLVHDPSQDFAVHVQVETSHKRRRWISFGSDRRDAQPLDLRSSAGTPYQTAHLDLAEGLGAIAAAEDLKNVRGIRFSGGYQVTGLRLLEPIS